MKKQKLVEIVRSFSYKMSLGNYQMADFFCSQKAEVPEEEAEKISEALYAFCKAEVIKSANAYKNELKDETMKLAVEKLKDLMNPKSEYGKPSIKEASDENSQLLDLQVEAKQ